MKTIVGRHINGITINPLEYVLESEDGDIKEFDSEEDAIKFLLNVGADEEDLEWFVFQEVEETV